MWVVVLFVLLGGGGNLFGNKGNTATQADIQRGFDYSNEMSQMRGLTYGQANSTYALTNGINGLEKTVMQGNFGLMQQLAQNQQTSEMPAVRLTETLMQCVQKGIETLAVS